MINNTELRTAYLTKIQEARSKEKKQLKPKTLKTTGRNKILLANMQNNYFNKIKNKNLTEGKVLGEGSYGIVSEIEEQNIIYKEIAFTKTDSIRREYSALVFQDLLQKSLGNDTSKLKYLCKLHEYGFVNDRANNSAIYAIMDNCGIELGKYINDLKTIGSLKLEIIIEIMIECSKALQVIHNEGYVHLDVKPENFLARNIEKTNRNGTVYKELEIKIIDFGLSSKKKVMICGKGTLSYTPPEMFQSLERTPSKLMTDIRLDIFSLGCFFVQLILFYSIEKCNSLENIPICPIEEYYHFSKGGSKYLNRLSIKRENYGIHFDKDLNKLKSLLETKYNKDKLNLPKYKNTLNNREHTKEHTKERFIERNIKFSNSIINKIMEILEKMINPDQDMRYSDISMTISDLEKVFIYSNNYSTNKIRNNKPSMLSFFKRIFGRSKN